MSRFCFFIFLFTFSLFFEESYAQESHGQHSIDSLLRELTKAKEDTAKVNLLNKLSFAYCEINPDEGLHQGRQALQLAEKLHWEKGRARAISNIGVNYGVKGSLDSQLIYCSEALSISKKIANNVDIANNLCNIGNVYLWRSDYSNALAYYKQAISVFEIIGDENSKAVCLSNTGFIYSAQSDYSRALEYYHEALKIYEITGDPTNTAMTLNALGDIYLKQGNYPEALKNFFAALKTFENIGVKRGIAVSYSAIGNVYAIQKNYPEALKNYLAALKIAEAAGEKLQIANLYFQCGSIYQSRQNYPEALKSYQATMEIYKDIGSKSGIAASYLGIGSLYLTQGNYSEALQNYSEALRIYEATGEKANIAYIYSNIGVIYLSQHKTLVGKQWLQKGLALAKETGYISSVHEIYLHLAFADSILGNYKEALKNYKMYTLYKDSLYNEENTKKTVQIQMQYDFDKKQLADSLRNVTAQQLANAKLQKQKAYSVAGAGIAALLLILSALIIRNNKKLSAEKQKSEKLLLNILPEEVAEELKEKGNSEAQQFDRVTVLFTDFVNFTTAGERMTPKELVDELHQCFKAFDGIIGKYNIEKIKTIGDAYLAVCGLPNADAQHAQHIVNAALDIRTFMTERRRQLGDKTFEIRVGIHSGSVVAGIVGVKKFAYDIWGDTVNTAARMEQNSEAGKVNISETTYELVKNEFDCTFRGEIEAKNKGMLKMYFAETG